MLVRWASLSTTNNAADSGQPFPSSTDFALGGAFFSDKSVQVYAFAAASSSNVIIQGSNMVDQVATPNYIWATLTDPQGNALAFDMAGGTNPSRIEGVLENPYYIRPLVTSISNVTAATQTVTVDLLLTSVRPARSGY